jgi:nitroimidazol reductase NimA-like FMN-containing flavoprotein (pyridoxamine 5'-phosphate oxidase superfamily)
MKPTGSNSSLIKNMEIEHCLELLGRNYIGRLAYISGGSPHVNPITYFHDSVEKSILSYSAPGHKIDSMQKYGKVAIQVDEISSIQQWRSVMILGEFEELEGSTAKKNLHKFANGVQDTITRNKGETPKFIQDFSSRLQNRGLPIVYRINIRDIVGKYRDE